MVFIKNNKRKKIIKITLLWVSSLSVLCTGVVSPALPLIKESFEHVPNIAFKIKMMVVLPNLFIGFFAPFFGYLSTKISKLKILVFSLVLYAIGGTGGFYLQEIEHIMYSRIVLGISIAALMTVSTSIIAEYFIDEHERNSVVGFQTTVLSIASIIYGLLGGVIADINWRYIFLLYVNSIFILPLVLIYLDTKNKKNNINESIEVKRSENSKNIRSLVQNTYGILLVCISNWLIMIMFYTIKLQLPFLLYNTLENINAKKISYILVFEVVLAAIVSAKYKRFKKNRDFAVITSMSFLFIACSFLIIALSKTYLFFTLGMIVYGIGMGLVMPNSTLWVMSLVKSKNKALFLGIFTTSTYIGKFSSPIILAPIISNLGVRKAFLFEGIFCIFIAVISMYINDYFKRITINNFKEKVRMRYKYKNHNNKK